MVAATAPTGRRMELGEEMQMAGHEPGHRGIQCGI
jgi:hypothetical protein